MDEVDSILIDEARTPLIISGPAELSTDKYYVANRVAKRLTRGQDYDVKEKERSVVLTEAGIEKAEHLVGVKSFYVGKDMEWPHLIEQAVRAHTLYHRDVDYVVREKEVVIVDEFTGRLMEGRSWSEGLHQAVEAKEGLSIRRESQTLATITLQNFFKLYEKLSGMTGTALTEAMEFDRIYELDVIAIPTNQPNQRVDHGDVVYRTAREKYVAIAEEIEEVHGQGRPILVGTTSIERSELLSDILSRRGIEHHVLNAKQHQREAEIVKNAGQSGSVVISTNMAGRGTDIVLGPGIPEKGGLHVIGTERHESRRIDNQLRGRCARQGDPGSSQFFLSLEDDLMRRFASDRVSNILEKLGMKEGEEISHPWVTKSITRAQKKVENYFYEIRKSLLEYDAVMNEQRQLIYDQRQHILEGSDLSEMIQSMFAKVARTRVDFLLAGGEPQPLPEGEDEDSETAAEPADPAVEIREWARAAYGLDVQVESRDDRDYDRDRDGIIERIIAAYNDAYRAKQESIGEEMMARVERYILLMEMDDKWKDHLRAMDQLRAAISLRSYAQKDPKIAYKTEGYAMFEEMIDNLHSTVSQLVLRVQVREEDEKELQEENQLEDAEYQKDEVQSAFGGRRAQDDAADPTTRAPAKPIVNQGPKVGRNDPCTCGSGKKYKKCCGVGK